MAPRPRFSELARLLDRAADPIYALDDERRIVLFNLAASEWTGFEADELLGAECRFHSGAELAGAAALAGTLCPPPEVFTGHEVQSLVACRTRGGEPSNRQVRFVPIRSAEKEVAGVLAFVSRELEPAAEAASKPAAEQPPADALHLRIQQWRQTLRERYHIDRLLGDTPAMLRVRAQVELAVRASASVLIVGPSGSGREHVARTIHYGGPHQVGAPLVPLACPIVGPELLRTTIAALARLSLPERQRGTLLLNDVDRLPVELQAELPRLLAGVGSRFRVISTSRQPLTRPATEADAAPFHPHAGSLLSTLCIELPSLVERLNDLPLLAQLSLERANARGAKQVGRFTEEALDALAAYSWRRNLDELDEIVQQAHANAPGPQVTLDDLPPRIGLAADAAAHPRPPVETIVLEEYLAEIERELIERALAQAKGNKSQAAQLLGLTRPRLYRRLVHLGLEADEAAQTPEASPFEESQDDSTGDRG